MHDNHEEERLNYALIRQVPAMRHYLEIHANYGATAFYEDDAQRIANLAQRLLERRLRRLLAAKAKAQAQP